MTLSTPAFVEHAQPQYYGASAFLIPVLLLMVFVGELKLKFRRSFPTPHGAIILPCIVVFTICFGEVAALWVMTFGKDSEALFYLTTISLRVGVGFAFSYLLMAIYSDAMELVAEPSGTVGWMLTLGVFLLSAVSVLLLFR